MYAKHTSSVQCCTNFNSSCLWGEASPRMSSSFNFGDAHGRESHLGPENHQNIIKVQTPSIISTHKQVSHVPYDEVYNC